ncbi:MAG: hypothetical protein LBI95_00005, partial [Holosporales bacterium]|nr:hypothetical protein [Holosporales bacterium]
FYKDFEKIKIEMLEEATLDSRIKAEHIAESVGSQVLSVHSLNTGVFELTPEDSSATTNETWNERLSWRKKIRVVVHGAFFFK